MPTFTSSQLVDLSTNLLKAAGATDEEARIVSTHLVRANLAGVDSHGILRLTEYIDGIRGGFIKPGSKFEVVNETNSTALVNGNWGFGQVVCTKAMQLAIQKADRNGVSSVGIVNCNHVGRLSEYSTMALEHGMISFIAVNADPCVAPYGGKQGVLSTSPMSYAIPAGQEAPIVVDFATSVVAEGKVRAALLKGKMLPEGWIVNSAGRPSTDPAELYEPPLPPAQVKLSGALLPAGGHKGYSLSLVVEALAGALTGNGCDGEVKSGFSNGVFIFVVKIENFVPLDSFKSTIDRLISSVRKSPRAEGFNEILIPGEPERREEAKRSKAGIPMPETSWESIQKICRDYGLDDYFEAK
ncbi:MAG TPA: Ldh family oxidoreductase [Candidatus Acidoferrum sp.]|nr:Ldh family oxidoreductase [Candidatus Acidoferrum sp.]